MKKIIVLSLLASFSAQAWHPRFVSPYEPKTAWKEKSIRVCWGNEKHQDQTLALRDKIDIIAYSEDQKKWIKEIITKEFKIEDVGIEFTGWENCASRVDSQVVLFRIEPELEETKYGSYTETGGRATIGQKGTMVTTFDATTKVAKTSYESSAHPHKNYLILNTRGSNEKRMDAENYIKILALHEFGHTAGLRHAHIRLEKAKEDPNCKRVPEIKLNQEPVFTSTRFAGPYDFNSIMNYCYVNVLISRTGLSFRAKGPEHLVKLTDPTLYTARSVNEKKQQYAVRVGLSQLDKKALRCMYDDATKTTDTCNYTEN